MQWKLLTHEKPDSSDDATEYLICDVDGDYFLGTWDGECFSSWNAVSQSYFDQGEQIWLTEGAGIVVEPVWWCEIVPPPYSPGRLN